MDDLAARFWGDLVGRLHGPLQLRLFLQPTMAAIFAIRDGLKDAREGRPAYFWAIFSNASARRALLEEGWKAVGRMMIVGAIMDAVYQVIVFRWIHPLELVVVVLQLAFAPYLILRGPINRLARWLASRKARA
jgi:hypothetical protein